MKNNNQKGVSVYITVIMLSILLAVSLGLSTIIVGGTKLSENFSYSTKALHAADTGAEQALYNILKSGSCASPVSGTCGTDCSYTVEITDPSGTCTGNGITIKSLGEYKGVKRKIEATIGSAATPPVVCSGDCSVESGGTCVAKAAGDYDLPACQRCDGVSLVPVSLADGTQDADGANVCNSTCKKCSAGACVNQTTSEDLFSHCSSGYTSCSGNYKVGPDGFCDGAGACKTSGFSTACATAGTCQTGGGCSSGNCVAVGYTAAGSQGTNCTAAHYVCNGSGSCIMPTTGYCISAGSPGNRFSSSCAEVCISAYGGYHDGCSAAYLPEIYNCAYENGATCSTTYVTSCACFDYQY